MPDDGALIVVVDDDAATCRAVTRLLEAEGYRVRAYTTARAYLDELDVGNPACVLLDIRMPDLDGLDLIRAMHENGGETPAVFMTATGHVPTVVQAMQEGALDLLTKPFTPEALSGAITRAIESSRQLRRERRALVDLWRRLEHLTPREAQVCALVACGRLNKSVAALIGTKEKTVKVHRGRVMQKVGASSLAELVRVADGLLAEQARRVVRLDGGEIVRPRAADIIVDVMNRECPPTTKRPLVGESRAVDQRTMPHMH